VEALQRKPEVESLPQSALPDAAGKAFWVGTRFALTNRMWRRE
jgi:hypothetical protein